MMYYQSLKSSQLTAQLEIPGVFFALHVADEVEVVPSIPFIIRLSRASASPAPLVKKHIISMENEIATRQKNVSTLESSI